MKIVLWGIGKRFREHVTDVPWNLVEHLVDRRAEKEELYYEDKIIEAPHRIDWTDIDLVVVFADNRVREIADLLYQCYAVPVSKITSWQYFLADIKGRYEVDSLQALRNVFCELQINKVIDRKNFLLKTGRFQNMCLDVEHADALLLFEYADYKEIEDIELPKSSEADVKYIILKLPMASLNQHSNWDYDSLKRFGKLSIVETPYYFIAIIQRKAVPLPNIHIYTVTHKSFTPPEDELYTPIQAGKVLHDSLGFMGDDTGESISRYNQQINECTALYWMWKNVHDIEYIGLNHYRRYFADPINTGALLNEDSIVRIMKSFDMIASNQCYIYPMTVMEHLKRSVSQDAFEKGMACLYDSMRQKYPEDMDLLGVVLEGYHFYNCNLFVMRKALMDEYCEWLFNIILPMVEVLDITRYDTYSSRIIGFLAERLLTVWVLKRKLRVKELQLVNR